MPSFARFPAEKKSIREKYAEMFHPLRILQLLLRLLLYELCEAYRIVWARVDINSLRTLFVRPVRFGDGAAFYGRNREPFIPITRAENERNKVVRYWRGFAVAATEFCLCIMDDA